jgi:glycosyltransferase involved in cell wall biosynthesis
MSKKKIAIVSILKPINDTRSYEKMAKSLAATSAYSITLIGAKPSNIKEYSIPENIEFRPLPAFKRLGLKRFLMPLIVLKYLIKLKPELVVVNTPELLIVTIVNQIIFGVKIVYDLQENYFRNLIFQNNYLPIIKHILGGLVRLKEVFLAPFIHHFILAERGYEKELNFIRNRFTIVENKAFVHEQLHRKKSNSSNVRFLFTGNISENSGVLTALSFYSKIRKVIPNSSLTIIGHCPSSSLLKKLQNETEEDIELIISFTTIDHSKITKQITQCDFGIVSYKINPSNENCMPTKVFEYLAYGLPIISQTGTVWTDYALKHKACIPLNFEHLNVDEVVGQLKEFVNLNEPKDIPEVRWISEEKKLISLMDKMFSK